MDQNNAVRDALVANLLTPIWRSIDADYKRKYSMTIWSQFEAAIKACARERSMPLVLEKLAKKFPVEISGEHAAAIAGAATSDDGAAMLRIMRTEATLLVVMVRVENEARKASYETHLAKRETNGSSGETEAVIEDTKSTKRETKGRKK